MPKRAKLSVLELFRVKFIFGLQLWKQKLTEPRRLVLNLSKMFFLSIPKRDLAKKNRFVVFVAFIQKENDERSIRATYCYFDKIKIYVNLKKN